MKTKKIFGNTVGNFDTGSLICKKVKEMNLSTADLSRLMGRAPSTMKRLLNGTSHQAYILYQFSCILSHNFFAELANWLPDQIPGKEEISGKREADLEQQMLELKAENAVLNKLLAAKASGG